MTGRTVQSARLSLAMNLAYSFYTAVFGIMGRSWWFVTLAAYYIILSVMRFAILMSAKKADSDTGTFIMRFTGRMLIFLSITMAGTAYLAVSGDRGTKHHEIAMITIALYSFTKLSLAIINLVKARKTSLPILKSLRNISLADAAASLFSLQRSMLVTFEGMGADDIQLMNILTGTAVYVLVFLLGMNLIGGRITVMAKTKLAAAGEKIADSVTDGYKKIESGTVNGYKKIESCVVESYTKVEDRFIEQFLAHDGETLEDAKARLKGKNKY